MKQFNLSEWLKDKSHKVVTRSGHNVRILCTNQRGNMPIVALVEFETLDGVQIDGGKAVVEEDKIEKYNEFIYSHHFDYRGLIGKGLALEAPEGVYNT